MLINNNVPTRRQAEELLKDAELCNPGPWGNHSKNVAICAEKIALACNMDGEKAYILGLLHDIGRKFGTRHLGHVYDGYKYMQHLGYMGVAKICLTHSFNTHNLDSYIGKFDITASEVQELNFLLNTIQFDDYDRLIQLCDALGSSEGIVNIEERMQDVKNRYGTYPQDKWNKNLQLQVYFEKLAKDSIYNLVDKK